MNGDEEGLSRAYNTEDGLFEDTNTNTLYIYIYIYPAQEICKWVNGIRYQRSEQKIWRSMVEPGNT